MSKKRWRVPRERAGWQPLEHATRIPPTPEKVAAVRALAERRGYDPDGAEAILREEGEIMMNDRYVVIIERHPDGWIRSLSVRRVDRGPEIPWRDLQRIKNEVAGPEIDALELYPAESRLVDTANQRWLWCAPPGELVPVGFNDGRHVSGPAEAAEIGARQS